MKEKYISIGKITNFHGIAGEVKVGYTNGKENQLLGEDFFYIKKDNSYTKLSVEKIRFHKNIAIIKFKEINSINEAIEFKGCFLYIPVENLRHNLEEDEFLVDDLVESKAYKLNGEYIGNVICINKQGSSDLLCIKDDNQKEYLVPFVKELVPQVDLTNKKIVINAIEGLIE